MARTGRKTPKQPAKGSAADEKSTASASPTDKEAPATTEKNITGEESATSPAKTPSEHTGDPETSQAPPPAHGEAQKAFSLPPKESPNAPPSVSTKHSSENESGSDSEGGGFWSEEENMENAGNDEYHGTAAEDPIDEQIMGTTEGILGEKFKQWISSYGKTATELFDLSPDVYAKLLVENERYQDLYKEFQEKYLHEKESVKREEGFATVLDCITANEARYHMPSKSDLESYRPVDFWAYMLYRVKYHLRDRQDGLLRKAKYSESAVWAISWIFLKQLVMCNRGKKKQAMLNGIRLRIKRNREKAERMRLAKSIYDKATVKDDAENGGPSSKKKKGSATEQGKKTQVASPEGGAEKASSAPPKASKKKKKKTRTPTKLDDTAPAPLEPSTPAQIPFVDPTENVKEHVPIAQENIDSLYNAMDRSMNLADAHRRQQTQQESRKLKLQEAIAQLEADPKRKSIYLNCGKALTATTTDFYDDFQHLDVKAYKNAALKSISRHKKGTIELNPTVSAEGVSMDAGTEEHINASMEVEGVAITEVLQTDDPNKKVESQLMLNIGEPTDTEKSKAQAFRRWLNATDYQYDNIVEAFLDLGICNQNFRVMPRQNPHKRIFPWQVIFTMFATKIIENKLIRGALCGDMIGLGKTISMAATVLKLVNRTWDVYESLQKDSKPLPPCVPYIYLTIPQLLDQSPAEFAGWSDFLKVVVIGDHDGSSNGYRCEKTFDPSSSPYCDITRKDNLRTIIVMSYNLANLHHGPLAAYGWMKEQNMITKIPDSNAWTEIPPKAWPGSLYKKFRLALCDEVQLSARNTSSAYWTTLKWLAPIDGTFLFSGYPAPRGVEDYYSYLKLIEDPELNYAAQREDRSIKWTMQTDPFELPDDHPAAKFRLTSFCFKKFILSDTSLDANERGLKAQKSMKHWLIRRDYESAIPIASNRTIARTLPPPQKYTVERVFKPTAKKLYKKFASKWERRLMLMRKKDNSGPNIPTPNGRAMRALELMAFNPLLGYLHKVVPANKRPRANQDEFIVSDSSSSDESDYEAKDVDPKDSEATDPSGPSKSPRKPASQKKKKKKKKKKAPAIQVDPASLDNPEEQYNPDRESWFYDQSELFRSMPLPGKKGKRIRWLLKKIRAGDDGRPPCEFLPTVDEIDTMSDRKVAETFMSYSPKLQATVALIMDYCFVRQEKMIVWFNYPIIQEITEEICHMLGIPLMSMYATSSPAERKKIQRDFNDINHRVLPFFCGMRTGGVGWNFQKACRNNVIVDSTTSQDQEAQVLGRTYRIGQELTVLFFQLVVFDTYNERTLRDHIKNSVEGISALMQHKLDSEQGRAIISSMGFTLIPDLAVKYSDDFLEGFFYEKDGGEKKLFHLATVEGQEARMRLIGKSDKPVPKDWNPDTAPAQHVLHRFLIQQHSKRLVQHVPGSKRHLGELVAEELSERRKAAQERGDISSSDGDSKPKRKKRARRHRIALSASPGPASTAAKTAVDPPADEPNDPEEPNDPGQPPDWETYSAMSRQQKGASTKFWTTYNKTHNLPAYKRPVNPDDPANNSPAKGKKSARSALKNKRGRQAKSAKKAVSKDTVSDDDEEAPSIEPVSPRQSPAKRKRSPPSFTPVNPSGSPSWSFPKRLRRESVVSGNSEHLNDSGDAEVPNPENDQGSLDINQPENEITEAPGSDVQMVSDDSGASIVDVPVFTDLGDVFDS